MSASPSSPELVASAHYPVTASLMIEESISRPRSGTSYKWIEDGMPEIATHKLLLLNWISFCLVHRRIGQTIAAGLLTHAGPRNATFLLATNEPLGHSLLDYSSTFFSSLQTIFQRQVQRMASGNEPFEDVDIQTMMDVVVEHAPARIQRKIERLTACGSWGDRDCDTRSNLDRIYSLWETHRSSSSPDTINCTRQSVMDDYNSIVECSRLPQLTGQARHDAFQVAQMSAKRLIRSPFIKESCELALDGKLKSINRPFILKFHRRLWRFRFYSFGAERVLSGTTAKNMRKLCQDGWMIGNMWLPREELKITLSSDRYSYVTSLLARKGYRATREILDEWLSFYKDNDVWQAGVAKICRVHPEMELMQYLSHGDRYIRGEVVGTSKRPCMMCHWCIEHGFKPEKKPFKLTQASRKVVTDWLSPIPVGTGGPVDTGIKDYISHLEEEVVAKFRFTRGESWDEVERSPNYDFEPRKY